MNETYVLGGDDMEMKAIEDILIERDIPYVYATIDGDRARRSMAYAVDAPKPARGQVWVECCHKDYTKRELESMRIGVIDHHSEGDPGYGVPSSKFWECSSLGMVCDRLGVKKTTELAYIAAADHCLMKAYSNNCPGIKREDLLEFRLRNYKGDPDRARDLFFETVELLKRRPKKALWGRDMVDVGDLRNGPYSYFITDASAYANISFYSYTSNAHMPDDKIFIGAVPKRTVVAFLKDMESNDKCIRAFGDPQRQFAGAYLERDQ